MAQQKRLTKARRRFKKLAKAFTGKGRALLYHEAAIVFGVISIVVVFFQLGYPNDRTLPFAKVADVSVGSLTEREAIDHLFRTYSTAELVVTAGDVTVKTTADRAGVLIDFEKAANAVSRYPWWQRMVPYSLFYKAAVINAKPQIALDDALAEQFAQEFKKRCDISVNEAVVVIQGSEAVLKPGTNGRECDKGDIKKSLARAVLDGAKATVAIAPKQLYPQKTNHVATQQFQQARALINSAITVSISDKKTVIPKEVLAAWVVFIDDLAKGIHGVELNRAAIRDYVKGLNTGAYVAPFPTDVYTIDGRETRRELGRAGRDLNLDKTTDAIIAALTDKKTDTIIAALVDIEPPLRYLHNYSQSQQGLERLLVDIAAEKGNYGITVMELGGKGRTASVNGTRMYVNASTYKLFVAYVVLKELESGRLTWDDVITGGLTVRQCFEEMIVRSANRCALAYKARFGAHTIVAKMHELGFTSLEYNTTWWSTPNDMTQYFKKLERGELLQGESRDFLLSLLKRQVWRDGIPAGVRGITVADKVGLLDSYLHDMGIIYSPNGTYILTIMTSGGSYSGMADVARRVEQFLRQ